MTGNAQRNEELSRHEAKRDQNAELNQDINLNEKRRDIAADNQNSAIARLVNIVHFLFSFLEVVLLTRVVLQLIDVNTANGFVRFINAISYPFVVMFEDLLTNPTLGNTTTFEITTLFAMLFWGVVGWVIGRLVWLFMSRPRQAGTA